MERKNWSSPVFMCFYQKAMWLISSCLMAWSLGAHKVNIVANNLGIEVNQVDLDEKVKLAGTVMHKDSAWEETVVLAFTTRA